MYTRQGLRGALDHRARLREQPVQDVQLKVVEDPEDVRVPDRCEGGHEHKVPPQQGKEVQAPKDEQVPGRCEGEHEHTVPLRDVLAPAEKCYANSSAAGPRSSSAER